MIGLKDSPQPKSCPLLALGFVVALGVIAGLAFAFTQVAL